MSRASDMDRSLPRQYMARVWNTLSRSPLRTFSLPLNTRRMWYGSKLLSGFPPLRVGPSLYCLRSGSGGGCHMAASRWSCSTGVRSCKACGTQSWNPIDCPFVSHMTWRSESMVQSLPLLGYGSRTQLPYSPSPMSSCFGFSSTASICDIWWTQSPARLAIVPDIQSSAKTQTWKPLLLDVSTHACIP